MHSLTYIGSEITEINMNTLSLAVGITKINFEFSCILITYLITYE